MIRALAWVNDRLVVADDKGLSEYKCPEMKPHGFESLTQSQRIYAGSQIISLSATESFLAAVNCDGSLCLFELTDDNPLRELGRSTRASEALYLACFLHRRGGRLVVTAGLQSKLSLHSLNRSSNVLTLQQEVKVNGLVSAFASSHSGRFVGFGTTSGKVGVCRLDDSTGALGDLEFSSYTHEGAIKSVCFARGAKSEDLLISVCEKGEMIVWVIGGDARSISRETSFCMSQGGQILLTADWRGHANISKVSKLEDSFGLEQVHRRKFHMQLLNGGISASGFVAVAGLGEVIAWMPEVADDIKSEEQTELGVATPMETKEDHMQVANLIEDEDLDDTARLLYGGL